MSDAKYFQRGKIQELRAELNSEKKDPKYQRKKMVMKKIVANMTMGNDMSSLFNDVVACMSINLLEIKKMVYLYLINYARAKPDLAVNATAYFLKDVNDNNPLIRALAIRTMSYIQVKKIMLDLVDPLHKSLNDSDPYVRKTATTCVAKLYMYDRNLVDEQGFIKKLKDLLLDANPTVVANAVAALAEISERSPDLSLQLNLRIASKLITALNDCNEWGQAYILETLLYVVPQEPGEAEMLAERIAPRLQHANSSVVLNAIKVIIYLLNYFGKEDDVKSFCKKLSPPLVTLLSTGPEVQYVVLRNILLVIQKHPDILKDEIKVFFCKYNDPIYVKLAKLEIIFRLATASNIGQVLGELVEYASEVDVDFVRKSVRAIGRLAIKIPSSTQRCISALLDLIQTKVNYVVQEGIVVIKDIFRKYPNQYESIIGKLCENLDSLDEPEAKAAMIWIIGQYADRIDNSDEILENFMESFKEDPPEVQLSLLTAVVKLFIKRPTVGQELVPKILKWSTEEVDNPDLRDRGFIYWRLLSMDPAAAKAVVLSEKPDISTETENIEIGLLDELLLHLATLSSVYHKVPSSFIPNAKAKFLSDSKVLHSMVPSATGSTVQPKTVKKPEQEKQSNVVIDDFFNNPYSNDVAPMQNGQIVNLLDLDSGDFASAMGHFNSTTDFGNGELAETNVTYGSNLLGQSMYGSTNSTSFYDSSRQNSQSNYMSASNVFSAEPGSYNGNNAFNSGSLVDSPFTTNNNSDYFNTANSSNANNSTNVFNTANSNYYSAQTNSSSNVASPFSTHHTSNGFSSPSLANPNGVTSPLQNVFGGANSAGSPFSTIQRTASPFGQVGLQNNSSGNLLGDYVAQPNSQTNLGSKVDSLVDSMNQMSIGDTYIPAKTLLLDSQSSNGIEVHCTFARRQGKKQMALQFFNKSPQTLNEFAIQFNKNTFGLNLVHGLDVQPLPPNGTSTAIVDLACQFDTFASVNNPIDLLQVAFKTNLGVSYSQTTIPLHILLVEGGLLDQDKFLNFWRELATSVSEFTFPVTGIRPITSTNDLRNKLHTNNLFTVADRNVNGKTYLFMSAKLEDSTTVLMELTYNQTVNNTACNCAVKIVPNSGPLANLPTLLNSFQAAMEGVLRS